VMLSMTDLCLPSLFSTASVMADQSFGTVSFLLLDGIEFFDCSSSRNRFSFCGIILGNNYKGNELIITFVNIYIYQ